MMAQSDGEEPLILALRESEERLRLATSAAELGIWVWHYDEDRVTWENDRPYEIFGLQKTADPLTAAQFRSDFVHPDDLPAFELAVEKAVHADASLYFLGRIRRTDGSLRWIELTGRVQRTPTGAPKRIVGTAADVTERELAQEQVRRTAEANAKFRAMFEQAAQFAGILSLDGTVVEANLLSLAACGLTREDVIGKPFWECAWWNRSPAQMQLVKAACAQAAAGKLFQTETAYFLADGAQRYVHLTIAPVADEQGRILYIAPSGTDITERMQAELALRESQTDAQRQRRVYEAILTNTPDLAYVFDRDHRFIYVNEGLLKIWGRTWSDAIGKTCLELGYEPWHAALHNREIDQVVATKQPLRAEVPFSGAFGRRIYDYIFVPVFDEAGEVEAVAGTTRDITERKQSEESLRDSEQRLRLALEAGRMGTWEWKIAPNQVIWSPGLEMIHGLTPGTFDGTFAAYQNDIHPDDRERVLASIGQTLELGLEHHVEYRLVWPDGSIHWVEGRGKLYRDESGAPSRMVGVCVDITERKQAEDDLRQLAAQLSEADRRKNEFLAMLAHELRNPLAPIRNVVQILRLSGGKEETVGPASEMMERQIGYMVRLVDDLLDVSRISRGKIDLRRERVELATVVQQALETSRPGIDAGRHELRVTMPSQRVFLDADAVRLAQVFSNLLNNSSKYSEPGGQISLTATLQGNEVVVSVKDSGIGIPADMLPRIFEMFAQVDRSLERAQGGLGIGLTLVQRLVEMHGGTVQAFSDGPGRGSEFVVRLPILVPEPPEVMPAANKPTPTVSRRILVVDDNRDSATTLAMLLKFTGNVTQTAFDGLEAVQTAETFRPDVMLLDIGLPKLNGYEAARRIRAQPWGRSMLLVALTGWGQDDDRRKSIEAGFNAHLVKPVDHHALMKLLDDLQPKPA